MGVTASAQALVLADLRRNKGSKRRRAHRAMWGTRKVTRTPTFTSISQGNNRATGSDCSSVLVDCV